MTCVNTCLVMFHQWTNYLKKVNVEELEQIARASLIHVYSRAFQDEPHDYHKLIPTLNMMQHSSDDNMINADHETDYDAGNVIVTALRELTIREELCFQHGSYLSPSSDHPDEKELIDRGKEKENNNNKMKDYLFFFMHGFLP